MNVTLFGNRIFAVVIKLRSYWIMVDYKSSHWFFYKRALWQNRVEDTHRENAMWPRKQKLKWYVYMPRKTKDCLQPSGGRKRQGRIFLQTLQREHGPSTPWFLISSLQNHERISFYCFKPPNVLYVAILVLGNYCR